MVRRKSQSKKKRAKTFGWNFKGVIGKSARDLNDDLKSAR